MVNYWIYVFIQWDTAGQERFRTITTSYYRNTQGILLVYDITDRNTFNSIRQWMQQINLHADVHVNKILIGNKCDLIAQRVSSLQSLLLKSVICLPCCVLFGCK